jgi:hypothetical protein
MFFALINFFSILAVSMATAATLEKSTLMMSAIALQWQF